MHQPPFWPGLLEHPRQELWCQEVASLMETSSRIRAEIAQICMGVRENFVLGHTSLKIVQQTCQSNDIVKKLFQNIIYRLHMCQANYTWSQ